MSKKDKIVIFDLDHTLLTVNSSYFFGKFLYNKKVFSFFTMIRVVLTYAFHRIGFLSIEQLHKIIFRHLFLGRDIHSLKKKVKEFVSVQLQHIQNPKIVQLLRQSRDQYLVILSSSPDFLVEAIANYFEVDEWQATRYDVDQQGALSHISKIVNGKEKAEAVADIAHRLRVDFSSITAYSDSYLDLPLLECVGTPIAVKPDRKLKRICKKKQWIMV